MNIPGHRLVISKRYTGLGDCITSLLGAWRFARRTQRTLVADWRFSPYATDFYCNVFDTIFESPPLLAGVPFIGDGRVNTLQPTGSFFMPHIWNATSLHTAPMHGERGDLEAILALLNSANDTPEDIVVFERCLAGGFATLEESRSFLSALRPKPAIAQAIERFAAQYFAQRSLIGVHVRHGNGGNIMGYTPFWRHPDKALQRILTSV